MNLLLKDTQDPSKLAQPLFGIVYNWKGLEEENYIYTAEELQRFDPELYEDVTNSKDGQAESSSCGWKTWICYQLNTEEEVKSFLMGSKNGMPVSIKSDSFIELLDEWYWRSCIENDFYRIASDTMKKLVAHWKIKEEFLTGDGFDECTPYEIIVSDNPACAANTIKHYTVTGCTMTLENAQEHVDYELEDPIYKYAIGFREITKEEFLEGQNNPSLKMTP